MEEVYTIHEFAKLMGVSWQQVREWKKKQQIPASAITPEGALIKSVIDPLVDAFKKNASTVSPSNQPPLPMATEQKKSKSPAKKHYPPKVRKEALRLLFEEKLTLEQTAAKIGCSVGAIKQWKAKDQTKKAASGAKKATVVSQQQPSEKTPASKTKTPDFDEFARQYWQEGTRAVDVLLLPPEIGPKIVNYVNEALKYAYERLR